MAVKKASKIKNINCVYSDGLVLANREAIEHRATWMGLMFDEMKKAKADAEKITRKAIGRTGQFHGKNIKARNKKAGAAAFGEAFLSDLGKTTFQMDVTKATAADFCVEFHYCPLISAWQKQGFDDKTCEILCDLAMEGDREIAKANGLKLTLTDTIAKGCPTCKLHFHK